ncbi:hypothetical protein [Streptomyces hoynatensis]|uniref:hypothetical protein n=1 Tax=Streptomyces hoynatensis TaxID=1141874 RepID=UPI001319DFF1|nr:hypothetical protein [Streptomyces hoynatensis]
MEIAPILNACSGPMPWIGVNQRDEVHRMVSGAAQQGGFAEDLAGHEAAEPSVFPDRPDTEGEVIGDGGPPGRRGKGLSPVLTSTTVWPDVQPVAPAQR